MARWKAMSVTEVCTPKTHCMMHVLYTMDVASCVCAGRCEQDEGMVRLVPDIQGS